MHCVGFYFSHLFSKLCSRACLSEKFPNSFNNQEWSFMDKTSQVSLNLFPHSVSVWSWLQVDNTKREGFCERVGVYKGFEQELQSDIICTRPGKVVKKGGKEGEGIGIFFKHKNVPTWGINGRGRGGGEVQVFVEKISNLFLHLP